MHVVEIALAVVKGTRLTTPASIEVDAGGLRDDRRFHVVAADRRQYGATRAALTQVEVEWDAAGALLTLLFPDGETVRGEVAYGASTDAEVWWDHRRVVRGRAVAGPFSAALADYLGDSVTLVEAAGPRRAHDVRPVTLLGTASVARLEREIGAEGLGTRRFRLNLAIGGSAAHEEDRWYGRLVTVGSAQLRITGPVPRCVVVTRDPEGGERDHPTLRAIASYRSPIAAPEGEPVTVPFGVYADVIAPGRIAVGDAIAVAEAR